MKTAERFKQRFFEPTLEADIVVSAMGNMVLITQYLKSSGASSRMKLSPQEALVLAQYLIDSAERAGSK